MAQKINSVGFFYHEHNRQARLWKEKIERFIRTRYRLVAIGGKNPQALIVLGGDGTILEGARKKFRTQPIILGLNLGHVGFLAATREPKKFLAAIDSLLAGKYSLAKRMMLATSVLRHSKTVFTTNSLNEVAIQSLLGMVELAVTIERHPIQYIRGSGVLIATATGSTAFNLSAHGPIVMPDIKCLIVTELMDHNIPTPSIVVKRTKNIEIKVLDFKKRELLSLTDSGTPVDVILHSDSETLFPLQKGDVISIRRSARLVRFAEIEKNYFFKSLQEKFAFR